jgi:hypothetical protein
MELAPNRESMLLARPDLAYEIACSSFLILAAQMLRMFSVT